MIRTRTLTFHYANGPTLVFPDVDLPQGAVLLLSGPSGCGKSTWLALVAGLVPATSGELAVADQVLKGLHSAATDAWRARVIGFFPQRLHLSPALTVEQNLEAAQWAAGMAPDPKAIQSALSALGVADLVSRKPAQLSGGQAQRVALARAVLLKPKVILADEPTTSLDDDAARDAVQLLLTTAQAQQASLVIASHDARVAALLEATLTTSDPLHRLRLQHPV